MTMRPVAALVANLALASAYGRADKVKLENVQVLTFRENAMSQYRRTSAVPQLKVVGGSAMAQTEFHPAVVQCKNVGYDGIDINWECKADLDDSVRFGATEVFCEGYEYPEDPYILKGSCGLEYKLELTAAGRNDQRTRHQGGGASGGYGNSHGNTYDDEYDRNYESNDHSGGHSGGYGSKYQGDQGSSWTGVLMLLAIVGGLIYCMKGAGGGGNYAEGVPPRGGGGYGGGGHYGGGGNNGGGGGGGGGGLGAGQNCNYPQGSGYERHVPGGGGMFGTTAHPLQHPPSALISSSLLTSHSLFSLSAGGGLGGWGGGMAAGGLLGMMMGGMRGMGGGYGGGYNTGYGGGYGGGMRRPYGGTFARCV